MIKTVVMPGEGIGLQYKIDSRHYGPIYLWGRIEYMDVFDKPHWTDFRSTDGDRSTDYQGWQAQTCNDGNNAD